MSRGIGLKRIIEYFKVADIEELDYVLSRGVAILRNRKDQVEGPKAAVKRRKRRHNGPDTATPRPIDDDSLAV
jgi:hypothetical protein